MKVRIAVVGLALATAHLAHVAGHPDATGLALAVLTFAHALGGLVVELADP